VRGRTFFVVDVMSSRPFGFPFSPPTLYTMGVTRARTVTFLPLAIFFDASAQYAQQRTSTVTGALLLVRSRVAAA
jgi:hypothetical protein